jgi:2-polyprenyl-6-methoxyphenol hydroxylase-like FAD-dependent oxidoreductase
MSDLHHHTDVLVVGAGPTGLAMACELLRRGVRVRVVERAAAISPTSRALGVQPRTLEVFGQMGCLDALVRAGTRLEGVNIYDGLRRLLRVRVRGLQSPYPYVLVAPQSETEHALADLLARLGGSVERGRELVSYQQDALGVTARVRAAGEAGGAEERVGARWLIGCDGAHSPVRKALGLPFEGSALPEEFVLADAELRWRHPHTEARVWLHHDGLLFALPLPGSRQWRLIANLPPDATGERPEATTELFRELLAERTGDADARLEHATWLSNFRIHRRMVPEYRVGRVFLVGDSAHIHSPVGGQGMNTGIQDAYNLGWKLVLVLRGKAPESLLDTYSEERLPIARDVLETTGRGTSAVVSRNPAVRWARDHVILPVLRLPGVQARIIRGVSELDINYRGSSLSRSPHAPSAGARGLRDRARRWLGATSTPRAGDRAPDGAFARHPSGETGALFQEFSRTGFTLLLFAGTGAGAIAAERLAAIAWRIEATYRGELTAHVVAATAPQGGRSQADGSVLLDPRGRLHLRYRARSPAMCLIRPDGYIGFRGGPQDTGLLLLYLSGLLATS